MEKTAKRWWKDHCQENRVENVQITWPYIKAELIKNYQNKTYHSERMNEFLDSNQGTMDLEAYYQHFLTLVKYAPTGMTQEVKVARFLSGLHSPLKERLQVLRLTTFTDVMEAGKPAEKEVQAITKRRMEISTSKDQKKFKNEPGIATNLSKISNSTLRDKAIRERLCYNCMDPNHQKKDCPLLQTNPRNIIPYNPPRRPYYPNSPRAFFSVQSNFQQPVPF